MKNYDLIYKIDNTLPADKECEEYIGVSDAEDLCKRCGGSFSSHPTPEPEIEPLPYCYELSIYAERINQLITYTSSLEKRIKDLELLTKTK